jgi:hypothetical protein
LRRFRALIAHELGFCGVIAQARACRRRLCAAPLRGEPPLEPGNRARDHEVEQQVDRSGADEDFDRPERLGDDLRGDARDFHQRDHRSERRRARHQDDLVAVGRQRDDEPLWNRDPAKDERARHSARARGLDLAERNGQDPAADDFAAVRGGVEREGEQRAPVRLAQERPQQALPDFRKLSQPVINEKDLDEERRATEDEDVAPGRVVERAIPGKAHQREQHGENRAGGDRVERELERQRNPGDEQLERLDDERGIHRQLRRTPRMATASARWNAMPENVDSSR